VLNSVGEALAIAEGEATRDIVDTDFARLRSLIVVWIARV